VRVIAVSFFLSNVGAATLAMGSGLKKKKKRYQVLQLRERVSPSMKNSLFEPFGVLWGWGGGGGGVGWCFVFGFFGLLVLGGLSVVRRSGWGCLGFFLFFFRRLAKKLWCGFFREEGF